MGGWATVASDAITHHKLISGFDMKISDLSKFLPLIFAGQFFNSLYQYTGSQDVVQRYQTTATMEETKKSLWTNGILAFITIPIFYGMGTVLFSFYNHAAMLPKGFNTSAIVPYFIVTKLPAGIAGLVIAAIFAAAQSTIASSLNAISSCGIVDFKQRFFNDKFKNVSDVALARWIIIISGLFSLAVAIYLLVGNTSETWNLFLAVTGLFGVFIAGIFAAGIFTEKANTVSAVIALIVAAGLTYYVQSLNISPFITSSVSFLTSFVVSYLVGLVTPQYRKDVTGLTVRTIDVEYTKK